jgi:hypothetical protein
LKKEILKLALSSRLKNVIKIIVLPLGERNLGSDDELRLGALNSDLSGELASLSVELDSLQQETLL